MGLAEHYRIWEADDDYFLHGGKLIGFSDRAWIDILNILRGLSDGLECDIIDLNSREGTASGIIEICDEWIYGEMRWDMRDPILHQYTLRYEVGVNSELRSSHFELTEAVLSPKDKSYIPSFVYHIQRVFPESSITTNHICTIGYYRRAI